LIHDTQEHAMSTSEQARNSPGFQRGLAMLRRLSDYHEYEAFGLEDILHVRGGAIVACNHSLATYDAVLLALAGYDRSGRWFHAMADRLLLRIPGLRSAFSTMGFIEGTRAAGLDLLGRGEVLGVLPGGMRESLRSSAHRYTIDWERRYGFVWLSLLSGAPIVLAACPRADDIFDIADTRITRWAYERLKLPLPVFRGIGPTLVPRPVKLWHVLSEPIYPRVAPDRVDDRAVQAHHTMLVERMSGLMRQAIAYPGGESQLAPSSAKDARS
jgi:hypothetical protein